MVRSRLLKQILDGALAAGAVTTAGCGCVMGRAYGPVARIEVTETSPELLKSAELDAQGMLDEKSCRAACGEYVESCAVATAEVKLPPPEPPPRTMSCLCDNHDGKPRFHMRRPLEADELETLRPDAAGNL